MSETLDKKYDAYELRGRFAESLDKFLEEEETFKGFRSEVSSELAELQSSFEYWLQTDMASNLAQFVQQMAEDAIEAMLNGDEDAMRRYLKCQKNGYTGRDTNHSVIRGRLFEAGGIDLRKKIVDAHAELLKNERILDLEDQLASVVKQYNAAEARIESLWERLR